MITVIVLSVLAAMILPDYSRSVARGHWRAARDVLWTIYAGEQVFQASNNTFVEPAAGCPNPPGAWLCIFMDDPNNGPVPVTFTVAGVTATTFTATATRAAPGGCGGWTLTINEQRVWGGSAPEEANVC
jgi:Tfp pilus assembly protein PilE